LVFSVGFGEVLTQIDTDYTDLRSVFSIDRNCGFGKNIVERLAWSGQGLEVQSLKLKVQNQSVKFKSCFDGNRGFGRKIVIQLLKAKRGCGIIMGQVKSRK
jgi:hypothetical protein